MSYNKIFLKICGVNEETMPGKWSAWGYNLF